MFYTKTNSAQLLGLNGKGGCNIAYNTIYVNINGNIKQISLQ